VFSGGDSLPSSGSSSRPPEVVSSSPVGCPTTKRFEQFDTRRLGYKTRQELYDLKCAGGGAAGGAGGGAGGAGGSTSDGLGAHGPGEDANFSSRLRNQKVHSNGEMNIHRFS